MWYVNIWHFSFEIKPLFLNKKGRRKSWSVNVCECACMWACMHACVCVCVCRCACIQGIKPKNDGVQLTFVLVIFTLSHIKKGQFTTIIYTQSNTKSNWYIITKCWLWTSKCFKKQNKNALIISSGQILLLCTKSNQGRSTFCLSSHTHSHSAFLTLSDFYYTFLTKITALQKMHSGQIDILCSHTHTHTHTVPTELHTNASNQTVCNLP